MRISIDSKAVKTKSGIGKNDKPYAIHTQTAYLDLGKRYPVECSFRIDDETKAFEPGEYVIDFGNSVFVDKFGRPALSEELALIPFGDEQPTAPKAK